MSSDAMLNIKEVVDRNVQYASIDDLQKKGKQRFKVMKLGQFYSLIERAVANVVESQALDIAEKDRQAIVDESNREFKRLFQERQAELQELQRKEDELVAMRTQLQKATAEVEAERRRREDLERESATRAQEFEHRLRSEIDRVRAQTTVLQEGESQLRQEVQRARTETDQARSEAHQQRMEVEQARSTIQQQQQVLEQAKTEVAQQRSESDATKMELQRVQLELDSERQRRAALEEAVQTTREHAETVSRDLDSGLREKENEAQSLRQELAAVRQELQAEQGKVTEMDQVLRLAKERVEGNTRDLEETARARTQAEQTCRELEAQLAEARAEATATARRAQEFEERATSIAQEKGALTEDTRKIQDAAAASERGRVEALERVSSLEAELRSVGQQLAEVTARHDSVAAIAQDRERAIAEKDQVIQELRAEIARLVAERDRLLESSQAEESERLRAMHEQFSRLSHQLAEEKEQHQETMKELLTETRAQKELFHEVRVLREQLDEARTAEGTALEGLSAQLGSLAPSLGEIQKTLEEGVPGRPGDGADVNEQIQAAIALGMETIKDQINLHVEGVNEKRKKELEIKAVEAAGVALDRLFLDEGGVESNVEVVEVRERKGGGIGDNLAKLRALKGAAPVEAAEGEPS